MRSLPRFFTPLLALAVVPMHLCLAQAVPTRSVPVQPTPPPATKLEAFTPTAGTVLTVGYDEMGTVSGIDVDAREMRDAKGVTVRGLLVEVTQGEYRKERAFVDADEIPELIKGIDALLAVTANPTSFQNFEVRYTTRGELRLTAFNMARGDIMFAVQAGRVTTAQSFINRDNMEKLRAMFAAAQQKLAAP